VIGRLSEELILVREGRELPALKRNCQLRGRHGAAGEVDVVLGEPVESGFGKAEVLRQKRPGGMTDPVGDALGAVFGEIAVVKDQNEVRRSRFESLSHESSNDILCVGNRNNVLRAS
jgi:hypothetical protein